MIDGLSFSWRVLARLLSWITLTPGARISAAGPIDPSLMPMDLATADSFRSRLTL